MRAFPIGALAIACTIGMVAPLWGDSPSQGSSCQPCSIDSELQEVILSGAELEAIGARIGTIEIVVNDVFDPNQPGEGWWLYRLVNRLHINTRENVVRHMLLFAEGDPFNERLLEETERLLRNDQLFFDAWVRPVRMRGKEVDVEVAVRDVWTLTAGVRFRREGGENATGFNLHDRNLLGMGKSLDLERRTDVDRTMNVIQYRDPNVLGSRFRFAVQYGDNSDGTYSSLELERPFFALDSRWTAGGAWLSETKLEHTYSGGHPVASYSHETRFGELMAGYSAGLQDGFTRRWTAGLTFDRHGYSNWEDGSLGEATGGRELVYPWFGVELVEDDFAEWVNLDQIVRTEDVHLGRYRRARAGWSSTFLGADRNCLVFDVKASSTFTKRHRVLIQTSIHGSGRWNPDRTENLLVGGTVSVHWRDFGRHLAFATFAVDLAHRLDPENQLLIGGDSGLRGYPLRYQDGDRKVLASIEQRFFTEWYPLKLIHVGAAVFVDVGHAWYTRDGFGSGEGALGDVGVGLRLSSSRAGTGNMLHVDVAFPVNSGGEIQGVQWSVRTKNTF